MSEEDALAMGAEGEEIIGEEEHGDINPETALEGFPPDSELVRVIFCEGPLGVMLRRRVEGGVVYVYDIVKDSQATGLNIRPQDELWSVGDSVIGLNPLDKEAWNTLIEFIKSAPRPLEMCWRRHKGMGTVPLPPPQAEKMLPPQEPLDERDTHDHKNPQASGNVEHSSIEVKQNADTEGLPETKELEMLAAQFHFRDKEKQSANDPFAFITAGLLRGTSVESSTQLAFHTQSSSAAAASSPAELLVKPGRKLLKDGELRVMSKKKTAIWASFSKRHLFLFNDLLVISIPTAEPTPFQVETVVDLHTCKLRSNGQMFGGDSPQQGVSEKHAFELIWPGGTLLMLGASAEEKEVWLLSLFLSICDLVGEDERVLGWRHQYMLGTMHSAVISRDEHRVRELIAMCDAGQLEFSDIEAADQYGYTPLHYACILRLTGIIRALHEASADVTVTDERGLTPLHWAAMQLDDLALSLLCSHVFDTDIRDKKDRTPLFLACVEGRDVTGKTDVMSLSRCLACLLALKADPNARAAAQHYPYSPLQYLAASWQCDPLEQLIDAGANVFLRDNSDAATALHLAAAASPLKLAVGEGARLISNHGGSDLEELDEGSGVKTLRALLRAGSLPNLKDARGKSPLQIVMDNELSWASSFEEALTLLISFGARVEDPSQAASLRERCPEVNIEALTEKWSSTPAVNADHVGIALNSLEGSSQAHPPQSDKTCIMCGTHFSLFRRQHHCRLCGALCCDDCSKRRALIDGNAVRACDSCFNRVFHKLEMVKQKAFLSSLRPLSPGMASRAAQGQKGGGSAKQELLGSATTRARSETTGEKSKGALSGASSAMSEAMERMHERGEKLSKLQDKSADMSDAASEFAKLAKQLNDHQRNRWF